MDDLKIRQQNGSAVFTVKIVPGSSKTALAGLLNGMLKIKISAPAEKSKANKELVKFLAKKIGTKPGKISIVSGQTNPIKQIHITGTSARTLRDILVEAKAPKDVLPKGTPYGAHGSPR